MGLTTNYGAAPTYVKLASYTFTATSDDIVFSNIAQEYTDLILVVSDIAAANPDSSVILYFNDDSGSTNYSFNTIYGNGTSAIGYRLANQAAGFISTAIGLNTTSPAIFKVHIMNYSNTTTYKSYLCRSGAVGGNYPGTELAAGLWRSTSPITKIQISGYSSMTIAAGSTITLYGIKAAIVPKATGGVATTDGTYWYHTFKYSGLFTPKTPLSADVLVVAGGGGANSGGGGAGGVIAFASQSLSSAQTVIVGAGAATTYANVAYNGSNSTFGSLTAAVGGGKGAYDSPAGVGGSGGGGGISSATGAAGTSGQGFAGGNASGNHGGGGGGAGAVGVNSNGSLGGAGGAGTNSVTNWGSLTAALTATGTGVSGYIAGGGGGGSQAYPASGYTAGGVGGGGNGSTGFGGSGSTGGTANTGGGGGGIYNNYPAGAGGSGLVIVRYAI